ncbi:salutaridinol 7-O-acetyltransferase-like [Papaver somniferum]|uniref:salutaridinol 7-O-acetyltransferase-like n=1 Tax=Papaver somniferum TaxID=3469 RepID=UPI000E6F7720|nr:salutaridinol 7-O-acetyltransferase-like [Papaver somniferum]
MIKVEVTSTEIIKPSSPTPDHLRTYKLSRYDQTYSLVYVPIILFYGPTDGGNDDYLKRSVRLKKSLSDTLTSYYPVAGRIKDDKNMSIECTDEGVTYIEARVQGNISDFMNRDAIQHLLPHDLHSKSLLTDNEPLLIVQVNSFDCNRIAICICMSHKIADATTFVTFINSWALAARGYTSESTAVLPTFDLSSLYPPVNGLNFMGSNDQQIVSTKRLVFDASKIALLRTKYKDPSNGEYPTRVQAVSALIWKAAIAASSSPRQSISTHAVNMRARAEPPLPHQSFGNLAILVVSQPSRKESEGAELAGLMKDSIRKINCEYTKAMKGEEGYSKFQESMAVSFAGFMKNDAYFFSSWCKIPLYEADFGWGKPVWASVVMLPYKNIIVLMDNKAGDGIEACVSLDKEEMTLFERNQELLDFVSFSD